MKNGTKREYNGGDEENKNSEIFREILRKLQVLFEQGPRV